MYKDMRRVRSGTAEPRQSILVAGSGRSGTTWISSVLAECQDAIQTFEPLNGRHVPGVPRHVAVLDSPRAWDSPGVYLRVASVQTEWHAFFQQLFDGDISCGWTRQDWKRIPRLAEFIPLGKKCSRYIVRKRYEKRAEQARFHVIKAIRANLLLGWLVRHFPARVIFVIRHPCAVVASRLHHGWSDSLELVLSQPALIDDYLHPMRGWIARAESSVDRLAVLWCIENLIPLRQPCPAGMTMHWYESFDRAPEQEFARLFETTRLEPTGATERAMHRFHSNPSEAVQRGQRDWHAGLGALQGHRVLDICNAFGLRMYGPTYEPLEATVPAMILKSEAREAVTP